MADDLDDDWWQSDDVKQNISDGEESGVEVAPSESGSEHSDKEHGESASDGEEEGLEEGESAADKIQGSKRKHEADSDDVPVPKKKKKKRKTLTEKLAAEEPKPLMPRDFISCMEKHYAGKLTPIQWDEIKVQDCHFGYCNDLSHTPNSYLSHLIPKWQKALKGAPGSPGSPLLLVISSAALRATQLNRDIVDFKRKQCKIAKLFAKHIKLKEQEKFLKKTVVHIGLGTPNRILTLLDSGHLHLNNVKHIVLDWSWRDGKLRRLPDVPEIRKDLLDLCMKHIIPHVKLGKAKIALM